jgi:2-keto-4-pentenoate hydratase
MARDHVEAAAALVARARLEGTPLPRLEALATLEDGYAAQARANATLEERLGPRVGHKIGGTTGPMRAYINVPEPVAGEIFATIVHPDRAVLRVADYRRAGVETEIAVRLGRDLPPRDEPYTPEDVADAVDALMAAIEIVDDRYEDFRTAGAPTLIADNAFDAGSVLGAPARGLAPLDAGRLRARTLVDGREVATGTSDALLGHPMDALAWLASRRSDLGLGLEAGSFVSLGSITAVQWVAGPARYRIEVEALGAVEVAFA